MQNLGPKSWRAEMKRRARQQAKVSPLAAMLVALLRVLRDILKAMALAMRPYRSRFPRPWQLRIGRKTQAVKLDPAELERLLKQHRDLQDCEKIAAVGLRAHLPESNFFADPKQVERLILRFLEENPPWLYLARVLTGGEAGSGGGQEVIWRDRVTCRIEDVILYFPADNWRDKPLSSLILRPARTLHEARQARLLDQILPPEVLLDRINRGEILIPVQHNTKKRLEFQQEPRRMEIVKRQRVAVPIETEASAGLGGQLLYFLLDYSASMNGRYAVLALSALSAVVRANMGRSDTRYLFRRYAQEEEIWPSVIEPPLQARTVKEKDALLDTIFSTNFNGGATHINHALTIAAADIENIRREEQLEATLLLVTDGRAEIMESTALKLRGGQVKVHTLLVSPERNPSLEALSESFTVLDIGPDSAPSPHISSLPLGMDPGPRRSFTI